MSALDIDIDLELLATTTVAPSAQDITETVLAEPTDERIEEWFREVLSSSIDGTASDTVTTSSSTCLSSARLRAEQETPTAGMNLFEFTSGSMGGQGGDMDMEMDRLLELLPTTGDEFQNLLASVMDDGSVAEAKTEDDWNWELAQPSVSVV